MECEYISREDTIQFIRDNANQACPVQQWESADGEERFYSEQTCQLYEDIMQVLCDVKDPEVEFITEHDVPWLIAAIVRGDGL